MFFPESFESEDNSNQDTVSNENDIGETKNVATSKFQENSIPSNIIDDRENTNNSHILLEILLLTYNLQLI